MKKYFVLSLIAFSFYFAEGLEFFLSLEKDTVYICEDIETRLVVKNLSKKPQKMLKPDELQVNLRILIVAPSGDTLINLFPRSRLTFGSKFLMLQPNDSIVSSLDELYYHFSLPLRSSTGIVYNGVPGIGLPPGTYHMKVQWEKILSNVVEFTIKQPEGKLVEAYDLYLEAFAINRPKAYVVLPHFATDEEKDKIKQLKKIVTELEKNNNENLLEPYGPKIYDLLIREFFCAERDSEGLVNSKFLIENFPNSKLSKWWLFSGVLRLESEDVSNDYLKYLTEKFPNTIAGNVARQELEKVNEEPKQNKLKDQ
jgi:hypothetical protein